MIRRRHLLLATGALPFAAHAQERYPDRQVRVVNPYAPGGSSDPVLRPVTTRLHQLHGQPYVIDNKGGAGTNIGSEIVAKAKPDGYTLLLGTSSLAINPTLYRTLSYDPIKDLQPIVLLTNVPNALAVHSSVPVKDVRGLIEYARANPGKLSYGSSGNGGTNHLGMEAFKQQTKVDMLHVPFKGGGPALNGLLAGDVQVMLSPATAFAQHAKAGRVRLIAIAAHRRVEGIDAPTMSEAGVPGFESGVWMAMFAPAGTPRPIVDKLNADINRILKEPEIVQSYERIYMQPGGGTPEDMQKLLRDDTERLGRLVKSVGVRVD
ncbi:Bug family tripartite tricarboxylate transporter substrate binding protein [Ramlibacter sp.]|uniref:Bug family tripartite tricarboxylate transporter substrate binding protein n=1 Tax=Ramlibacter sp. TaxID=1917967 RepID=UPI003D0ED562